MSWSPVVNPRSSLIKGTLSCADSIDPALLARKKKTVTVDVEGGRYMAMMKILPSGNLIRYSLLSVSVSNIWSVVWVRRCLWKPTASPIFSCSFINCIAWHCITLIIVGGLSRDAVKFKDSSHQKSSVNAFRTMPSSR